MDIKISKSAHSCAACEADFAHDQTLTSTVRVFEGALQRNDFCENCWQAQVNKKAYSVWKTVYIDPKVEDEQPAEVFSPLRQLFYEAAEEKSRIEMAKAFLAAGLLRRQKVFRLIKESDDLDGDIRITLYTDRIGNRLIEVPDPQFSYAEMDEARTLLLARLQELEAPPEVEDESPEQESATDADQSEADQSEADQSNENDASQDADVVDKEDALEDDEDDEEVEDEFDDDDDEDEFDDDEDEFDDDEDEFDDDEDEFDDDEDEFDDDEDEFDDDDDDDDDEEDDDEEDEDEFDDEFDDDEDDSMNEFDDKNTSVAPAHVEPSAARGEIESNEETVHAEA